MSEREDPRSAGEELAEDLEPLSEAEEVRGGTTPISNMQQQREELNKQIASNLRG